MGIDYYWLLLTGTAGVGGALMIMTAVIVGSIILLLSRSGPPLLVWVYLLVATVAAGAERSDIAGGAALSEVPALPTPVLSVASAIRYLVMILTAMVGVTFLVMGRVRSGGAMRVLYLLVALAIVSAMFSVNAVAFQRAGAFALIVACALVACHFNDSYARQQHFFKMFFWFMLFTAALIMLVVATRPGLMFSGGRFRGFARNANAMVIIATICLAPAIWAWLSVGVPRWMNAVGPFAIGFWVTVIVLTGSRAGMVGLAPMLGAIMLLGRRRIGFWIIGGVVGVGALLLVNHFMGFEAKERLTTARGMDITDRMSHTMFGLRVMWQRPLIGHGWGYADLYAFVPGSERLPIHNSYVKFGIDLGLVGLVLFGIVCLLTLGDAWRLRRLYRTMKLSQAPPVLLGALMLTFLANGLVEGWMTGIGSFQLFFFVVLIGAINGARVGTERQLGNVSSRDRHVRRAQGLLALRSAARGAGTAPPAMVTEPPSQGLGSREAPHC